MNTDTPLAASLRSCRDCRYCGPDRTNGILCNHPSWTHWGDDMRVFAPDFAPNCRAFAANKATSNNDIARPYGDCDCDEQSPSDDYVCAECERAVIICAECHTIIAGCDCGLCPDGATFQEN